MKILKTEFRMNGLPYTLLKRNDVVALYGLGGTYTDEILHWEVDIIYVMTNMVKGKQLQIMKTLGEIVVGVS
jgi:hypothetical protein